MRRKGVVRAGEGVTLAILNEDMNDIIRIIKLLENLDVLTDGVRETVKLDIEKQEGGFLAMLFRTLAASVLGNMLIEKVVLRVEKVL